MVIKYFLLLASLSNKKSDYNGAGKKKERKNVDKLMLKTSERLWNAIYFLLHIHSFFNSPRDTSRERKSLRKEIESEKKKYEIR